jgi:hypothetical protein
VGDIADLTAAKMTACAGLAFRSPNDAIRAMQMTKAMIARGNKQVPVNI